MSVAALSLETLSSKDEHAIAGFGVNDYKKDIPVSNYEFLVFSVETETQGCSEENEIERTWHAVYQGTRFGPYETKAELMDKMCMHFSLELPEYCKS